jgi:hypothetical protein
VKHWMAFGRAHLGHYLLGRLDAIGIVGEAGLAFHEAWRCRSSPDWNIGRTNRGQGVGRNGRPQHPFTISAPLAQV